MKSGAFESPYDFSTPPSGAWLREQGAETCIGATVRTPLAAFPVALTLLFFAICLGGAKDLAHFWSGQSSPWIWLIALVFPIATIALAWLSVFLIWGRVELQLAGDEGSVWSGVGGVGRRRRFRISDVEDVREEERWSDGEYRCIVLRARKEIAFGHPMSDDRRRFMLHALRAKLRPDH